MPSEEIRHIVNSVFSEKIVMTWWQLVLYAVIAAATIYATAYFKKRAENSALRKDLNTLTEKVEAIKAVYARQIEEFKSDLQDVRIKNDRAWIIKRDACLKALNIANGVLSNYKYPNVRDGEIHPQETDITEVRACFNELACSCDNPEVIAELKRILIGPVSPDAIVDLRNAVRKELNFGLNEVDTDREKAFIGRVIGQRSK